MTLGAIPKLADLLADSRKAAFLPADMIPAMLGELERLKATLWVRLTAPQADAQAENGDRLLDVREAKAKLGVTEDWLYRHANQLPFTVRVGKKQVRFSDAGIDRYIRNRAGR